MLLVRPTVSHIGWFSFANVEELLELGYNAMKAALADLPVMMSAA